MLLYSMNCMSWNTYHSDIATTSHPSPDVPGPLNAFTTWGLHGCDLDAFPITTGYPNLGILNINMNSRVSGPLLESHLARTPNLESPLMTGTGITSLPNAPRYMHKLQELKLPSMVNIQLLFRNLNNLILMWFT